MLLLARARELDHHGPRVIDVALYEAAFMLMESLVPDYDAYGVVRDRPEACPGWCRAASTRPRTTGQ
jgi:crotonobetainyl-CoA:carnitine CoA-transferase CaiB-like acyl-CoA transferase